MTYHMQSSTKYTDSTRLPHTLKASEISRYTTPRDVEVVGIYSPTATQAMDEQRSSSNNIHRIVAEAEVAFHERSNIPRRTSSSPPICSEEQAGWPVFGQ